MRSAAAGNDGDGFSEASLHIDEVGWFPLRVRAGGYGAALIEAGPTTRTRR